MFALLKLCRPHGVGYVDGGSAFAVCKDTRHSSDATDRELSRIDCRITGRSVL